MSTLATIFVVYFLPHCCKGFNLVKRLHAFLMYNARITYYYLSPTRGAWARVKGQFVFFILVVWPTSFEGFQPNLFYVFPMCHARATTY